MPLVKRIRQVNRFFGGKPHQTLSNRGLSSESGRGFLEIAAGHSDAGDFYQLKPSDVWWTFLTCCQPAFTDQLVKARPAQR